MSKVTLISISQPRIDDLSSAAELIAYCARVSNPGNQLNTGTASKLLGYLASHHHWSPFEMVSLTMELVTTRDIARQVLRHRSFSFQEFSQRYTAVTYFEPPREARLQDETNRQASTATDDQDLAAWWREAQEKLVAHSDRVYRNALAKGIAKEVARSVLPEGLTSSKLYMAGTLRSWIHYVQLRTGNGTQPEHRELAEQAARILLKEFPSLSGLLPASAGEDS